MRRQQQQPPASEPEKFERWTAQRKVAEGRDAHFSTVYKNGAAAPIASFSPPAE